MMFSPKHWSIDPTSDPHNNSASYKSIPNYSIPHGFSFGSIKKTNKQFAYIHISTFRECVAFQQYRIVSNVYTEFVLFLLNARLPYADNVYVYMVNVPKLYDDEKLSSSHHV